MSINIEAFKKVVKIKCDLEKQLKHKNQLWKTAFRAYKNLKKKVENKLFPVEFLDIGRTIIPDMPDFKNNVVYKFSIPWQKVKEYMLKKNKRRKKQNDKTRIFKKILRGEQNKGFLQEKKTGKCKKMV